MLGTVGPAWTQGSESVPGTYGQTGRRNRKFEMRKGGRKDGFKRQMFPFLQPAYAEGGPSIATEEPGEVCKCVAGHGVRTGCIPGKAALLGIPQSQHPGLLPKAKESANLPPGCVFF